MTMELAKYRPSPTDLGLFYETVRGLLGGGNLWMCLDEVIDSVRLFWRTPGNARAVGYAVRCDQAMLDMADVVAELMRQKSSAAPGDEPRRRGTTKLVHAVASYRRAIAALKMLSSNDGSAFAELSTACDRAEATMFAALDEVASDN